MFLDLYLIGCMISLGIAIMALSEDKNKDFWSVFALFFMTVLSWILIGMIIFRLDDDKVSEK